MTEQHRRPGSDIADLPMADGSAFTRMVLERMHRQRRRRRLLLAGAGISGMAILILALMFVPASPASVATVGQGEIVAALFLIAACSLCWLLVDSEAGA